MGAPFHVRAGRLAAVWLVAAAQARAVDLHIRFQALERLLAEQVFTEEGKRYVSAKRTRCNFAYLQKARVEGEPGRLRIRARFTGRTSLDVLGRCVGLGDEFNLLISARPEYRGDSIALAEVKVASEGKSGVYIRRVCAVMAASLQKDFRYPIAAAAKSMLESPAAQPGYPRELRGFAVREIRVTAEDLVLTLDFNLTVR